MTTSPDALLSADDTRRMALRRAALRRTRAQQAVARRSVLLLTAGAPPFRLR
jgi:hypothetical protein